MAEMLGGIMSYDPLYKCVNIATLTDEVRRAIFYQVKNIFRFYIEVFDICYIWCCRMSIDVIVLRPIGFVRVDLSDEEITRSLNGVKGYIEILPEYVDGLKGLDGFSDIILIAYLHKVDNEKRKSLAVKPFRRFAKLGMAVDELPMVGVFATDSPHRPNPIALTIVKLLRIENNILYVDGLDLFNETPILDIKPYTPNRRREYIEIPWWFKRAMELIRDKVVRQSIIKN